MAGHGPGHPSPFTVLLPAAQSHARSCGPPCHRRRSGCWESQCLKGAHTVRATTVSRDCVSGRETGQRGLLAPRRPRTLPRPGFVPPPARRHAPLGAREGGGTATLEWQCSRRLSTPNDSVCCFSGQSILNKNDPHVLVFV